MSIRISSTARLIRRKIRHSSSSSFSSSSKQSNFFQWYSEKLETHPILTKAITSGIISGSADLICQAISYKKRAAENEEEELTFDLARTGRFTFMGSAFVAPIVHNWYGLLGSRIPGNSLSAILKRLFCDQILFAPLFIPSFMTTLFTLEGQDMNSILPVLKRDVPDVVVSNWTLWIPAMFVNFAYIPLQWQVLYSNCVGLVWNIYVSWKTQEESKSN